MSEVFSILLHNRQRYEQGKEGLWFSLPTTTEKLQEALREIGISADNPQDFFLYDYRSPQERPVKLPRDLVLVGFSKQLSGLFVRSSDVAVIVGTYFLIVSIGYVLNTVTNCYLGALNGMGKPSISMFLMIFYYIVVRMPLAYLLSYLGFGLNGIWVAVLVSHIVASLAATMTGTVLIRKKGNIKA